MKESLIFEEHLGRVGIRLVGYQGQAKGFKADSELYSRCTKGASSIFVG